MFFESSYPVSRTCPKCSSKKFKTAVPHHIAVDSDRVCKQCGTRYTPPTPAWGPYVMILSGLLFVGYSAYSLYNLCVGDQRNHAIPIIELNPIGIVLATLAGTSMIFVGLKWIWNKPFDDNSTNPPES